MTFTKKNIEKKIQTTIRHNKLETIWRDEPELESTIYQKLKTLFEFENATWIIINAYKSKLESIQIIQNEKIC